MNKHIWPLALILIITSSCFDNKDKKKAFSFKDKEVREIDKISYAIGQKYSASIKEFEFDKKAKDYLIDGLVDGFESDGKLNAEISFYSKKIDKIVQKNRADLASKSKQIGKAFVSNLLKTDDSYISTDSGLVYKIIKKGKVKEYLKSSFVNMRYESKYIDGKVYESTMSGNSRRLPIRGIFPAWVQAFSICGVGCEIEIIAPPELTYGDNGALPYIQPGEYLSYRILFVGLEK